MKNVWWFSKIKEGEAPTEKRTERKREQTQGAPFGEFQRFFFEAKTAMGVLGFGASILSTRTDGRYHGSSPNR